MQKKLPLRLSLLRRGHSQATVMIGYRFDALYMEMEILIGQLGKSRNGPGTADNKEGVVHAGSMQQ
jgi:hypothetical protein